MTSFTYPWSTWFSVSWASPGRILNYFCEMSGSPERYPDSTVVLQGTQSASHPSDILEPTAITVLDSLDSRPLVNRCTLNCSWEPSVGSAGGMEPFWPGRRPLIDLWLPVSSRTPSPIQDPGFLIWRQESLMWTVEVHLWQSLAIY